MLPDPKQGHHGLVVEGAGDGKATKVIAKQKEFMALLSHRDELCPFIHLGGSVLCHRWLQ